MNCVKPVEYPHGYVIAMQMFFGEQPVFDTMIGALSEWETDFNQT